LGGCFKQVGLITRKPRPFQLEQRRRSFGSDPPQR